MLAFFINPNPANDPSVTKTPFDVPSTGAKNASPVGRFPLSPFAWNNPLLA